MTLSLKEKEKEKKKARAEGAEVYYGEEICREKIVSLLTEMGLPNWLLPSFEGIKEFGYVNDTGFVWLKQKQTKEHKIDEVEGKIVFYETEITAYVEPKRIKKLTGVKAKELFIWITLSEIRVDEDDNRPSTGTITFKIPSGLSRSFAISVDDEPNQTKPNRVLCPNDHLGVGYMNPAS